MAKRNKPESPPSEITKKRIRWALQFTGWTLGLVAVAAAAGWLHLRGERFLVEDERFHIPAAEPGGESPGVVIQGARHASAATLASVFAGDHGQSLYRLDPAERREALKNVEWVRDASVRRVWPNRVAVEITEREPAAFLVVSTGPGRAMRPLLIDEDGALLTPRGEIPSGLPLVRGIRATDHPALRRDRIRHAIVLLGSIGDARENLLEIDVTQPDNLKIIYRLHEQEFTLILGNARFGERLERFTSGFPEWKQSLQDGAQIDLTDDTRILLVPMKPEAP
jgi:cell division septal protein FtsQ